MYRRVRLEGGVGLALAIDEGLDVVQQVGQVFLGAFASPQAEGIDAADAAGRVRAVPLRMVHPVPAQFAFGLALATGAEQADGACHEEPAIDSRAARRPSLAGTA